MNFVIIAALAGSCSEVFSFGAAPPPAQPETFAPGVISTEQLEYAVTFTPDCQTAYFSRRRGDWGHDDNGDPTILYSNWQNGVWSTPTSAPFSSQYGDDDPFITSDGRYLYFASNRPKTPGAEKSDYDIWRAEWSGDTWLEPVRLPAPINSDATEFSPALGSSGAIYFSSDRSGGFGQGDIYVAYPVSGANYRLELMPASINSPLGEWNVGTNAAETILLFEASQREKNLSTYGDLYFSTRNATGGWKQSEPLSVLNTTGSNLMPRFSPDETYLFYGNTETLESRNADILFLKTKDALLETTKTSYIAVANRSEHVISLVNAETYQVVAKIDSGKGPHEVTTLGSTGFAAASYGVYNDVADVAKTPRQLKFKFEPSDGVVSYDFVGKKQSTFSLDECNRPHGIEASSSRNLLWVTCEDEHIVLEMEQSTGEISRRWNTNANGSHIVLFDEQRDQLYVGNVGSGGISIINRRTGKTKVLKTGKGAEGLAITPDGKQLWVTNTQGNTITVIDIDKESVLKTFKSNGRFPVKIAITPNGEEAWLTQNNSRELSVFDTEEFRMVKTIPLQSAPLGLLMSPDGERVFITLPRLDRVEVYDTTTKERIASFSPGIEPDGMSWIDMD